MASGIRGLTVPAMVQAIAVGTDGSDTATKAVEFAIDLAQRYGARLVVISSYQPIGNARIDREQDGAPEDVQWEINPHEDVDAIMAEVKARAEAAGVLTTTLASEGDPADVLVKHAEEQGADVLVVGNKGMHRRVLGSVPNTVTHTANCTVVVVKTT
jgi:nucleotide-binding universal stress UspA family protein